MPSVLKEKPVCGPRPHICALVRPWRYDFWHYHDQYIPFPLPLQPPPTPTPALLQLHPLRLQLLPQHTLLPVHPVEPPHEKNMTSSNAMFVSPDTMARTADADTCVFGVWGWGVAGRGRVRLVVAVCEGGGRLVVRVVVVLRLFVVVRVSVVVVVVVRRVVLVVVIVMAGGGGGGGVDDGGGGGGGGGGEGGSGGGLDVGSVVDVDFAAGRMKPGNTRSDRASSGSGPRTSS